jgi:pimeloyl-ACP methyl ester carboxylesterase
MTMTLKPVLERKGCVLYASDSGGRGVPVLFSHGAGADSAMFAPQLEPLIERGYRVVTWDLRGHGASRPASRPISPELAVDDLVALVAALELDRPVLVGQSLGGNLSQAVVRRHPGLARALIVIDSTWNAQRLTVLDRALLRLAAPSLALIPASRLPRLMADASAASTAGRAYAEAVFGSLTKGEFLDAWRATVGLLDPDPGSRTPIPLALIRGDRDRTGNIAAAMPRWAAAEGIEEHVITGAGHLANLDAPDAVNGVLLAFLDGLPR